MDNNRTEGLIIRSLSGFYYVEAAESVYECRARGVFRKEKSSPVTGDRVEIETQGEKGVVVKILPRKNVFVRPPVANVDVLFIVSSVNRPKPNLFVLDKLSAFAVKRSVEPVFVFTKTDTGDADEYVEIYRQAGFRSFACSALTRTGLEPFADLAAGKLCAFTGNSGVGKSSLLNALIPSLSLETNEISDKLGRGKHTTRSVSLYPFAGGYIADTPGFSSMEFEDRGEKLFRDELADCFPDFLPYMSECLFSASCAHVNTKGCGVIKAVEDGRIPRSRYESYLRMYEEVRNIAEWEK